MPQTVNFLVDKIRMSHGVSDETVRHFGETSRYLINTTKETLKNFWDLVTLPDMVILHSLESERSKAVQEKIFPVTEAIDDILELMNGLNDAKKCTKNDAIENLFSALRSELPYLVVMTGVMIGVPFHVICMYVSMKASNGVKFEFISHEISPDKLDKTISSLLKTAETMEHWQLAEATA